MDRVKRIVPSHFFKANNHKALLIHALDYLHFYHNKNIFIKERLDRRTLSIVKRWGLQHSIFHFIIRLKRWKRLRILSMTNIFYSLLCRSKDWCWLMAFLILVHLWSILRVTTAIVIKIILLINRETVFIELIWLISFLSIFYLQWTNHHFPLRMEIRVQPLYI